MKQSKAPETTPSPPSSKSQSTLFVTMALDMTWRLAIVVLVPMIGGFKLDKALGSTPVLTILGFVLAMAGMAYVMWATLQKANQVTMPKKDNK